MKQKNLTDSILKMVHWDQNSHGTKITPPYFSPRKRTSPWLVFELAFQPRIIMFKQIVQDKASYMPRRWVASLKCSSDDVTIKVDPWFAGVPFKKKRKKEKKRKRQNQRDTSKYIRLFHIFSFLISSHNINYELNETYVAINLSRVNIFFKFAFFKLHWTFRKMFSNNVF